MTTSLHILPLEDNASDRELVRQSLPGENLPCEFVYAASKAEFAVAVAHPAFGRACDCWLTDEGILQTAESDATHREQAEKTPDGQGPGGAAPTTIGLPAADALEPTSAAEDNTAISPRISVTSVRQAR